MTIRVVTATLIGVMILAGCTIVGEIKAGLSTYEEPTDGPRARLRLVSDQTAPFVYPARACIDPDAAGSGVAPDSRPGMRSALKYRTIGMPNVAVAGGRAMTEIYAQGDEPITFTLTAGGCGQYSCPLDKIEKATCTQSRTFIPEASVDYVASIRRIGASCDIQLFRIVMRGQHSGVVPEDSEVASQCSQASR